MQGNHGEDVKECYFYLDATPTCSYAKALYKYPQSAFPYEQLIDENQRRSLLDPELELMDTGTFAHDRYFDVVVEYAKNAPDDVLVRITIVNHGHAAAPLVVLPTLWFRNTWSWGCTHEGCTMRPLIRTGETWYCSTSTSTETQAAASAQAIRQAGQPWWRM